MIKLKRIIVCSVLACGIALGGIELPSIFSDNMVLQRNSTVNIWGTASPGARVSISGSCMEYPVGAQADSKGNWRAGFKTVGAGGDYTLTVKDNSDNTQIELQNILCGEVWLCSGQSNMQWSLARSDNAEAEIAAADYPQIRLFAVPAVSSPDKQSDVNADWKVCSPDTVKDFSAVAYFFGRELNNELNVPIGLIRSAWGGSRIEAWIPTEGYEGLERLADIREEIEQKTPGSKAYRQSLNEAMQKVSDWQKKAATAMKTGTSVDDLPAISLNLRQGNGGTQGLYNAMIHPIAPYTIKGALWYQGESNRVQGMLYYEFKKALIGGWRQIWQQGDFPFYYVHLAPYKYQDETLPLIWEAQLHSLNIPNTGMAVTNDIGDYEDIHPTNKQDVGKRLALWALAKDYGKSDIVYSGPLFKSASFEKGKAVVRFSHSGSGLATRDGEAPDWFEIAGGDGEFHNADAKITGKDTVEVWAAVVQEPKIVRLGWDKSATPNLMNKEGLPTVAFSSDIERRILPAGKNYALNKPYVSSDENQHGTTWRQGLTNGSWAEDSLNCFASNQSPQFPKYATIDLENVETISKIYFGVPSFGSTKTVQVEISTDGKDFRPVGKYEFSLNKSEKVLIAFEPQEARFVRLAYLENHSVRGGVYDVNFVFTTEVEVYEN